MKILVTGFDPFGGDKINPAIEAVKRLPDEINGAEIVKLEIPTVFNKSAEVVKETIENENPDYVLNVGQAGGRFGLTPERVAININDGRIRTMRATNHLVNQFMKMVKLPTLHNCPLRQKQRQSGMQVYQLAFQILLVLMYVIILCIKSNI